MKPIWVALFWSIASCCHAEWTVSQPATAVALPGGAQFLRCDLQQGDRSVRMQGVFFDQRSARFAIIDNPGGASLGEIMPKNGALAGTNGAYFHPDHTPVGLVIADGKKVHPFERAKLLSGVFVVTKGRPRIVRSGQFTGSPSDTEALQSGPFLVEDGKPIAGLNAARSARRTVVATDGSGRWALLTLSSVSLEGAAALLATGGIWPGFTIKQALNLDGGSSTGLWVANGRNPFYAPEFATVRNFVAILPR